ncbi:MAG: class I SAM-dependent methyltransferase [Planctomycetales bacterium]|nr:class I SAM-dependent methyltransferase [Planctomycetales bacterium]
MTSQTASDWNNRYVQGDTPWDNNLPDSQLQRVLTEFELRPSRVLELGCGTGTNAVFLAQQGFAVTAMDIAPLAIAKAQSRAQAAGVAIDFSAGDILECPAPAEPFPLVFDRGVYHCVRRVSAEGFCRKVADATAPGGLYFTVAGNANEAEAAAEGPPRVTAEELCREFSPLFDLVLLREARFDPVEINGKLDQPLCWAALWRRKTVGSSGG